MPNQIDLAVTRLTNDLPQLFSVDENFVVHTTWLTGRNADALWTPWHFFPGRIKVIAVTQMADGRPYLLGIHPDDNTLRANWKVSTDPDDAWSGWTVFDSPALADVVAVPLVGGALQIFGVAPDHSIVTCFDTSDTTEPAWSSWQPFSGALRKISAGNLSDGRPQLFGIAPDGTVLTAWKTTLDTSAPWSDWTAMGLGSCRDITVFPLSNGALQILACEYGGPGKTCWKVGHDPDAAWSAWESFPDHTYVDAAASCRLPDGRAAIFGIDGGSLTFNQKVTLSSAAAWTGWKPFLVNDVPPGPLNCTFAMESIQINSTRSLFKDTVFISASLAIGPYAPQTRTRAMGKLGNGLVQLDLAFDPIQMADKDTAVLTYAVVNNGHSEPGFVVQQLESATKKLAQKGADAVATAAGGALGAALGASIGTAAVPILGTAIGALAGWIVDTVGSALFANCDGTVAAGVHFITGAQLRAQGFMREQDFSDGTDSPDGCGDKSAYWVTWTVDSN
ncbi:MAG: hypothetical protein ACTHL8_04575 [Burkholderiaceae bacterium]